MTLALLAERGPDSTICPSEVARALTKASVAPGAAVDWRGAMPAVHDAIDTLVAEGLVRLSWKRKALPARIGPYRIARAIPR